jgi:carboxypeptidase A2
MRGLFVVTLLVAAGVLQADEMRRYDGYQLINVYPTEAQVDFVVEQSGDVELDFWYEGRDRFDILVPPHKVDNFKADMASKGIVFKVAEQDIQTLIDVEQLEMKQRKSARGQVFNYDDFNTLEDIFTELDSMVARCPPGMECDLIVIGQSYQGRDIKGLRMRGPGQNRKAIWTDATIHAREWLATATLLKIMKHLVDDYNDLQVAALLQKYDFYLLPVVNPDGYSYTHTNERLWRKNRTPNAGSTCLGTDLNRNYDQMWGNAGASTNPCSDTYRGATPGSEPETVVTQGALRQLGPSLIFSMHIHTYGHLWLIPWGSVTNTGACNYAADHAQMMVVANAGANAVQSTWNIQTWARGNSCDTIYPASGITMDYSKGLGGVFFTVTPELRGTNFIIAATNIEPSFREVWNGFAATQHAIDP